MTQIDKKQLNILSLRNSHLDSVCGQILRHDNSFIFLKLTAHKDVIAKLKDLCSTEMFNVRFLPNRTSFLLQHNALDWIERHHLFDCLVNNECYNSEIVECVVNDGDYHFW